MDVESCSDNLLFLQKAVLGGAPVSVTFTLDLVSGCVFQQTCPEGLMRGKSPAAVGRCRWLPAMHEVNLASGNAWWFGEQQTGMAHRDAPCTV